MSPSITTGAASRDDVLARNLTNAAVVWE